MDPDDFIAQMQIGVDENDMFCHRVVPWANAQAVVDIYDDPDDEFASFSLAEQRHILAYLDEWLLTRQADWTATRGC